MPISAIEFDLIRDLLRKRSGIDLEKGKEYLVEARISGLMRKLGIASQAELMTQLRLKKADVERDLIDAMTTNETSFFRDVTPFEMLRKSVLPDLITRRTAERELNIWCAASSTGQEPYTLAMTLRESFPQLATWRINFIASDLSRDVLAKAREGKFSQLEVNRGLPAPLLVKYFKKQGLEWQIREDLRNMIDFKEINLTTVWPSMPTLDLVFIRNVLIYFNIETKRQVLGRIRMLMRPDAYLFLGVAESTMNIDDKLVRGQFDKCGCYQVRSEPAAQSTPKLAA